MIPFQDNDTLGKYTPTARTGATNDFQRETVARLTTYCERLIRSGALPPENELQLRTFVNLTCTAFDMAPVQEFERDLEIIREVMEQK